MSVFELKEALQGIPGIEGLTLGYAQNGHQIVHLGNLSVEVSPMASNEEIRSALLKPTIPTQNTKVIMASPLDRIKQKALSARSIAPTLIKEFETDLDNLIAEGPKLKAAKDAAVGQHMAAVTGLQGEFDGLQSAIDILSNGGPPLDGSSGSAPSS